MMTIDAGVFTGPFDLLLSLIDKREIDIMEINISDLADDYLESLGGLMEAGMEDISAFIFMAATLLEIKSRLLLPQKEQVKEAEESGLDLLSRLAEYKLFSEAAKLLSEKDEEFAHLVFRETGEAIRNMKPPKPSVGLSLSLVDLEGLYRLFVDCMSRKDERLDHIRKDFGQLEREQFKVEDKVALIRGLLPRGGTIKLSKLFLGITKPERVVTFLAVLELIKLGEVLVSQSGSFGEISLKRWERVS